MTRRVYSKEKAERNKVDRSSSRGRHYATITTKEQGKACSLYTEQLHSWHVHQHMLECFTLVPVYRHAHCQYTQADTDSMVCPLGLGN
jgi:hypothetical protein